MNIKKALTQLFFPDIEKCFFCGDEFQGLLCPRCEEALSPLYLGEQPFSLGGFPCVCLYGYAGPVRAAIYTMKFDHLPWKAVQLGRLLARLPFPFEEMDAVTFVPVHPKRRAKRGFDQAELLARGLGETICKPVLPTLVKEKNLTPQSRLSAQERLTHVAGAFSLRPQLSLRGRKLLLVDDVITTGATICEAGAVLAQQGAQVFCMAAARTISPRE